jgi:hypothetical protein
MTVGTGVVDGRTEDVQLGAGPVALDARSSERRPGKPPPLSAISRSATNPRLMYAITGTLQALFSLNVMRQIGFTTQQAAQAWRDHYRLAQRIGEYPSLAGE